MQRLLDLRLFVITLKIVRMKHVFISRVTLPLLSKQYCLSEIRGVKRLM